MVLPTLLLLSDIVEHVPVIQTHPPPNEPAPSLIPPPQSRHRLSSAREQPVRRLSNAAAAAASKADRARSNSFTIPPPSTIHASSSSQHTLEYLAVELDRINRETTDLAAQLESEEDKNRTEVSRLDSELEDLRARRREDDDSKACIKAETKTLEEQKRSVDAQKSKLERALRGVQDELAKLECEASARLRDLAEKEQALADLQDQTSLADRRARDARTLGREGLEQAQRQIAALEESNKLLAQKIAQMKSVSEVKDPEEEKARIKVIDEREDVEDEKVEQEWIESEKSLKARTELVKSQFDDVSFPGLVMLIQANREFREALALLVQARELHPSSHPVPATKHRSKKQRSRRTRQKALSLIGQINSSSPRVTAIDPSVNTSRPASLQLPPGTGIGMFYPSEYPDGSMMPYEYQSSSPWASTHSLGLMHDIPHPLDTALRRERLTGGALLSPSISEHLLPSNLFGPEEDSIRTSPYIEQLLETAASYSTPRISSTYPHVLPNPDSPVSEMSPRSSFSSPNQSHPVLPTYVDRIYQDTQSSPTIIMTPPATHYSNLVAEEEPVEVTSPAELNGIPLSAESAENTDDEVPAESTSSVKHWKIPSISFKRKTLPLEKRLPALGTLKGEKARSMPRTSAGATPIGFNRPRSGSGSSSGWLYNVTRARAPSETGRQFDINFDPLESRRLLEGAGVVHHHSALARPIDFSESPRQSFDSRSSISRRSTDADMARLSSSVAGGAYFRTPSLYSEISSSYVWLSQPSSASGIPPAPLSLPTSPSAAMLNDRWGPPSNASRSSLDPKAPEFRTSLQQQFLAAPEVVEPEPDVSSNKRFGSGSRFALSRRSTVKPSGDSSFLNNFTGLFRRDPAKNGEDEGEGTSELIRPKSQDTQNSGDPSAVTTGTIEDLPVEGGIPEKKKKEKKKKDKGKSKSLFRWDSKPDILEDPELASLESVKDDHESEETPKKKRKKKGGKKGVKFEKEDEIAATSQETAPGPYYYQGKEVTLDEVPVKVLDYFR